MSFAQPLWLLLLLLLPVLAWVYRRAASQRHVALQVSRQQAMRGVKTWVVYARKWIQGLRWIVLALIIVAMARPQKKWFEEKIEAEAIDIMLVIDVSASMLSKDFSPDRLTVAKQVARDFVSRRRYDRLGLVVFRRRICPVPAYFRSPHPAGFYQQPASRSFERRHCYRHGLVNGCYPPEKQRIKK